MISQLMQYNAFYDAVLACALLSNDASEAYRADAKQLIEFYCRARSIDAETTEAWTACILDELSAVAKLDEREATYSRRAISRRYRDSDLLCDVKCDVISEISAKYTSSSRIVPFVNPTWFDYSHVVLYNPFVRFRQLQAAASSGWRIAAREVGIMMALGMGCDRDVEAAKRKFLQCTYWCDVPSAFMLSYLCAETGDEEGARQYADLANLLVQYLSEGVTVVPADVRDCYDLRAVAKYAQVSSIYRDICCMYNREDIDYSFVEVMMDDTIDDYRKMAYINNYQHKTWVEATNPSQGASHIGFVGGPHGK